jgi:cytochrome-b5 reductase
LTQHVRRYASEAGPAKSSSLPWILTGSAILGVGGYITYARNPEKAHAVAHEAKDKIEGKKEELTGSSSTTPVFTGGDQGFVSLKLEESEVINSNTKRLKFSFPEGDQVSGLHVACMSSLESMHWIIVLIGYVAALLTKYKGPEMEKPVLRPYTPTSDEDAKGFLELVVKKYPNGPMSTHLHDMEPGQRLDFKGPLPKYAWAPNKHSHIALIAGGTGITPMYQLIRAIFSNPDDKTKVSLIFGNIKEEDILLKKELEEVENTYPQRFKAFYLLDQPTEKWQGGAGFVTKELLKTVLPEPKEGDAVKIFVCGPPGLYKAVSGGKKSPQDQGELDGHLKELGYSKDQVYKF